MTQTFTFTLVDNTEYTYTVTQHNNMYINSGIDPYNNMWHVYHTTNPEFINSDGSWNMMDEYSPAEGHPDLTVKNFRTQQQQLDYINSLTV